MDPNRPYMSQAGAKEFTKLFNDLNKKIASVLLSATTLAEAEDGLGMLEGLAGYDLPEAKTMYGLALLMQDKPWYDLKKGVEWLRKGAEEAAGERRMWRLTACTNMALSFLKANSVSREILSKGNTGLTRLPMRDLSWQ